MATQGDESPKGLVCVTGAGGFLASALVKVLLEKGYRVRGTVRDPANEVKTRHLRELPGAQERLELMKADLLAEGSFDAAVDGCDGVFHTASPIVAIKSDPYAEMVTPAVTGTLNVLKSIVKAKSVKKVVVTSSSSAFRFRPDYSPDVMLDESSWSDIDWCTERKLWYPVSKTTAEKAAWSFAKENAINLVTILPTYIVGPVVPPDLSATSADLLGILKGTPGMFQYSGRMGYVHLDDVISAHILAFENPSSEGRYICSSVTLESYEMTALIAKRYPDLNIAKIEKGAGMPYYNIDTSKIKKLGLEKTKSLEEMFDDLIACFKAKGLL